MSLTKELYQSVESIWEGFHVHPFVKGIADGTLPLEKFRFYMIQDYLYLYEYAKVFALGVVKAEDHNQMRMFSQMVDNILNGEMTIHQTYMKRLGISEEEAASTQISLANAAYTNYMLKVAYQGDVLEILVVILACAWSYQLIGEKIARNLDALYHEFYGEWIQGYASKEYAAGNVPIIQMIDEMGDGITSSHRERLKRIFIDCSRFEGMFWDMAYEERE